MAEAVIHWPWTSRARLEDALDQIAHLRAENAKLTDSLTRIGRREAGLPETPRSPRPPLEPMPQTLHEYIRGFATSSIQKMLRDQYYKRHAAGERWDKIMLDAMSPETKEPHA